MSLEVPISGVFQLANVVAQALTSATSPLAQATVFANLLAAARAMQPGTAMNITAAGGISVRPTVSVGLSKAE